MKIGILYLFTLFAVACNSPDTLNIIPAPVVATEGNLELTGPQVLNDPERFVWGGSVVKGYDGKYHMLYSTWECGDSIPPFRDSWLLYSKIAYAVSEYPDRDFKHVGIVLKGRIYEGDSLSWDAQTVHNPHLKKFNNKYYLYYTGSRDPGKPPKDSPGFSLTKRNRIQQVQKVGAIEFESFEDLIEGNFDRPEEPLLSPRTRVKKDNVIKPSPEGTKALPDNMIVVNPSVVFRPSDGKYLLYFKGNLYDPHWRGVHGVAISDSPLGPFTPQDQFVFDVRLEDGKIASAEDPYVWYHSGHKRFYAIFKDFTGKITGGESGLAIMYSKDGIDWKKPRDPFFMRKEVILTNGDTISLHRMERPQILVDEEGNPLVLYAAASVVDINPRQDGKSFNIHVTLVPGAFDF